MGDTNIFIKDRATKTISAAKQITTKWTWQEMSNAQMQAALTAIIGDHTLTPPVVGQEELASGADRAMATARGMWDTALNDLHDRTVQGLNMCKNRNKNNSTNMAVLNGLKARGTSRPEILAEALAWETAWAKIDATWSPVVTNTYVAYKSLRESCSELLQHAFTDASASSKKESKKMNSMCEALEQSMQSWYADATRVFTADTAEGEMIRGSVPTTYSAPAAKPTKVPKVGEGTKVPNTN